jgi:hypothetical protein
VNDAGTAAIALRFSAGAGAALGRGAESAAMAGAGLAVAPRKRPVFPFSLPPGLLTTTTVGSFLDLPEQFGPPTGWFWDVVMLSAFGFTAGAIAVSKNAPLVTAAGAPVAIEPVGSFAQAGVLTYPQKGIPLLDGSDRLVFTVTSALTAPAGVQFSGQVIAVPAERIDEYLS